MRVLVTGGSGHLGRRVVAALSSRGHRVSTTGRNPPTDDSVWVRADFASGEGLDEAVAGVEVVVHCATDPRRHRRVDVEGTRRLVKAAGAAGVRHIVYPGIVGSDLIPLRYYESKVAAEELVAASGMGWTILRSTQFHQLIWSMAEKLARFPVMPVPAATRFQPIDPQTVAEDLADAVEQGPQGRLPDIGGAYAYEAKDLARSYLAAGGLRRLVVPVNYPGLVGAAFRAGANLTPNRDLRGRTWNDFVATRIAALRTGGH